MQPAPSDIDAEAQLLGVVLLDSSAYAEVSAVVGERPVFQDAQHAAIWGACRYLIDQGQTADLVSVAGRLRDRGHLAPDTTARLSAMCNWPVAKVSDLVARVVDKYRLRQLRSVALGVLTDVDSSSSATELLERAEADLYALHEAQGSTGPQGATALANELLGALRSPVRGISTGLPAVDKLMAGRGLVAGKLYVVAGRPGSGKSVLGAQMALHATRHCGVALFSLEMGRLELMARYAAASESIDLDRLTSGEELDTATWKSVSIAIDRIRKLPLWIDDTPGLAIAQIRARARRIAQDCRKAGTHLGLIVVDYLGLISPEGGAKTPREQAVAQIARSLKVLAKELGVAVVALCQLNRSVEDSARKDKRPQLSDLRESGAVEQEADLVAMVFRPHYYDENADPLAAEVLIRKQRSGKLGTVALQFHGQHARFCEPPHISDAFSEAEWTQ